ncbi:hypothetical protein DVA67_011185 [Solirubrobacter sp. CPCC 204708]|uniref:PASTA domain-containing protein n=1 Tax=Solirubrobacter deserti TaxID=2282478 RepID=A0ABT4RHQ3_9ACTN|nr:hypothetical protein [Solirubrobacter deserti]MBE2316542.1 hypothetical protein [Solirubrobacter deserti]MDA0138076.1 hypothetical protein [Solirubrobacter deserti]
MRVALVILAAALAALAAAVVYTRAEDDAQAPAPRASATPGYEQRAQLAERISRSRTQLAGVGVYLGRTELGASCVRVSLINPTPPNTAYVERRFPGACVDGPPAQPEKTCRETARGLTLDGDVNVPELIDLPVPEASQRVLASELVYTTACLGDEETEPWAPAGAPDTLLRVVAQCPRPGERVRAGTEVALQAAVVLPGDFRHQVGALDEAATGTASPCGDGRNPRG